MCSLEWLGRLKCRATGLDASLSSFSTSRRCSRNRSPNRLPVSPMYSFLHEGPTIRLLRGGGGGGGWVIWSGREIFFQHLDSQ